MEDFGSSDLEYKKAVTLFSQEITPEKVKIGRRSPNSKQKIKVTIPTVSNNTSYKMILNGTEFEFISGESASIELIVDGLITAIN